MNACARDRKAQIVNQAERIAKHLKCGTRDADLLVEAALEVSVRDVPAEHRRGEAVSASMQPIPTTAVIRGARDLPFWSCGSTNVRVLSSAVPPWVTTPLATMVDIMREVEL